MKNKGEGFVVSARKYRPDTFEAVVGQSHVTNTLKNALKHDQLAHAFLFSGPRGVGKTTCARILATSINCLNISEEGDPCGTCASCMTFLEGRSLNIHELDAASNNSVEDIRKIIEQVRYVPTTGKKSVFIIDEVHMLSQSAFNAFLKTLEEPPPHAIFILATTEKHKILPTILSRCQKFDFRRIKVDSIADHLKNISEKEGIEFEYEALQLIGLKADGALRDALSIFDQIVSFSGGKVTYAVAMENLNVLDYDYFFQVLDLMKTQDHQGLLMLLNEVMEKGFDVKDFMVGLNEHFRNLLVAQTPKTLSLLETSDNIKKKYLEQSQHAGGTLLLNAFNLVSESESKLKAATNPRLMVELTLLKLAYLGSAITLAAVEGTEKKKSIAPKAQSSTSSIPTTPATAPDSEANSPPPPSEQDAPPLTSEDEPKVSDSPPDTTAGRTVKKNNSMAGMKLPSLNIPNSLADVDISETMGPGDDEDEEELIFEYNPKINILPSRFSAALERLREHLREESRESLRASLNPDYTKLEHNRWTQIVNSSHQKKLLLEEKWIVTNLREALDEPTLMLEILVEELKEGGDSQPYTVQDRLKLMQEKNPHLEILMKKFDAMINY